MIFKLFNVLFRGRAAQQTEPPAVEPPAPEVPPTPSLAAPQGPEDVFRKAVARAAVQEAVHWFVEEVLPNLF
jgi:hypothetical protein